jgi:glycosyltransferase involved in cell wall biosynthesis
LRAEAEAPLRGPDEQESSPLVSVIIPVYNAGMAVIDGIRAIQTQTYSNLEIIVVDDASSDDTATHVEATLSAESRSRFLRLRSNHGPAGARNAALDAATGDFVWFADWDDQWQPTFVEQMVHVALAHGADVVVCRASWRHADGRDFGVTDGSARVLDLDGTQAFDLLLSGVIKGYLWNKIFRREVLEADPFPDMRTQEDICALAVVLPRCSRVILVPDKLYHHVKRVGSLTNSRNPPLENLRIARDLIHKTAEQLGRSKRRQRLLLHYDVAFWHLATIGTALRLADNATANNAIDRFQREVRFVDAVNVSMVSMGTSARAVTVKSLGRGYGGFRNSAIVMRDSLRAAPRRLGQLR